MAYYIETEEGIPLRLTNGKFEPTDKIQYFGTIDKLYTFVSEFSESLPDSYYYIRNDKNNIRILFEMKCLRKYNHYWCENIDSNSSAFFEFVDANPGGVVILFESYGEHVVVEVEDDGPSPEDIYKPDYTGYNVASGKLWYYINEEEAVQYLLVDSSVRIMKYEELLR